jgi:hypothetical protein
MELTQRNSDQPIPQGDGADRPFYYGNPVNGPVPVHHGPEAVTANKLTLAQVGELLRAIDAKVLRDVLPAWARVTALAGTRVIAEDWTGGRAKFSAAEDRDKAWARLSGIVSVAIASAHSLEASRHWRLASSFIRYLALLEYQNAVTALNNQRDLGLTLEQVTTATNDVVLFGRYAGVLS